MWCLNVVKSHYSFRSYDFLKNLFKCIFPDSAITEKFSMGIDKARYLIIYGIFPAFKQKIKCTINDFPWFSISFDESLNRNLQKCQMDVNLRYWNNQKRVAETSCIDSQFVLRPNAANLKNVLVESLTGLEESKFPQLAMAGPRTNWNLMKKFDKQLIEKGHKKTINIGPCSLHIHSAFQIGATKTDL